jgi:hypothetical protein
VLCLTVLCYIVFIRVIFYTRLNWLYDGPVLQEVYFYHYVHFSIVLVAVGLVSRPANRQDPPGGKRLNFTAVFKRIPYNGQTDNTDTTGASEKNHRYYIDNIGECEYRYTRNTKETTDRIRIIRTRQARSSGDVPLLKHVVNTRHAGDIGALFLWTEQHRNGN